MMSMTIRNPATTLHHRATPACARTVRSVRPAASTHLRVRAALNEPRPTPGSSSARPLPPSGNLSPTDLNPPSLRVSPIIASGSTPIITGAGTGAGNPINPRGGGGGGSGGGGGGKGSSGGSPSGGTPPGNGGGGGFDISRILYLAGGATLVYALYDIMKRKVLSPSSTTTTDPRMAAPGSAVVMPGDTVTITAVDVPAKGAKNAASTTTGSGKSTAEYIKEEARYVGSAIKHATVDPVKHAAEELGHRVDHASHRAETKLQKEGARAQLLAAETKDAAEAKADQVQRDTASAKTRKAVQKVVDNSRAKVEGVASDVADGAKATGRGFFGGVKNAARSVGRTLHIIGDKAEANGVAVATKAERRIDSTPKVELETNTDRRVQYATAAGITAGVGLIAAAWYFDKNGGDLKALIPNIFKKGPGSGGSGVLPDVKKTTVAAEPAGDNHNKKTGTGAVIGGEKHGVIGGTY